ncbi:MAG: hypothetical protein QF570_12685 [Myxococcota bacterium]|nr:hypothetical protein [Myxococcota bacterium]
MRAGLGGAFCVFLVWGVIACVPLAGGWSIDGLASRHADVTLPAGHRLGDTPPHFWPTDDGAVLFLCRFDTGQPISIVLPEDATASEREDLRLALRTWEQAGLGVRFREFPRDTAHIVVRYDDAEAKGLRPIAGTGLTVTDCEVGAGPGGSDALAVPARLVRALVILRRSNLDTVGRDVPLSRDERVGAALHEIGHALGFGGHEGSQASIMTTTTERIRAMARRVREGEGLSARSSASVAALYSLPNGAVVGRVAISPRFAREVERARGFAVRRGWRGPFVRVGERNAQLHWRREDVMAGRLALIDYSSTLRAGRALDFAETPLVRIIRADRTGVEPN